MPFLFVDYDQGAGGEYLCFALSQSPQCVPLTAQVFDSGRTKIKDFFDQEFLKCQPQIKEIEHTIPDDKYVIVPTHRNTQLAAQLFDNIKTVRIQHPKEKIFWDFLKYNQIKKVLLSVEPTDEYFIGYLKCLKDDFDNTDFLRKVRRNMDNLTLLLLAKGIDPTQQARDDYLENLKTFRLLSEPDYQYDLVLPYEQLHVDVDWTVEQIKNKFSIDANLCWFKKFQNEFREYQISH